MITLKCLLLITHLMLETAQASLSKINNLIRGFSKTPNKSVNLSTPFLAIEMGKPEAPIINQLRISQQTNPLLSNLMVNPSSQPQLVPTTQRPKESFTKLEPSLMLETTWDGDVTRKMDPLYNSSSSQKWPQELTKLTTESKMKMTANMSKHLRSASLSKIPPLLAMPSSLPKTSNQMKRMPTYSTFLTHSTQSSLAPRLHSILIHSLLLLSMLNTTHSLTRIDLKTHHIVSYNKPLIAVDDFLKTTLKYNFGTDLYSSAIKYKESFEQLALNFRTPYQPLIEAFRVLFGYLGITPVTHPFSIFLYPTSPCPIEVTQPGSPIQTIGQIFEEIITEGSYEYEALASYWLTHIEDLKFLTRQQVWAFICPSEFAQASIFLPNYSESIYNSSIAFCNSVGYDLKISSYNDTSYQVCNKVNFLVLKAENRRQKRWDSSYVCGWPLVSSAAKVLGGECTTNIDVDSLKSNLHAIQNFSLQNTELIHNLQEQLTIVNARTNLHYNQLLQLVNDINNHQARYIADINNLIEQVRNTTNVQTSQININSIILSYTNSLFRVYQTIVDYRFSYIETLNSIQQHYHFPSEHMHSFNQELLDKLKAYGFTIPIIGNYIPYSYGVVRYLNVTGINFYDLEFDVYIPITRIHYEYDTKYWHSTLSALPIGINLTHVTYNQYQGSAICTDLYCLETPLTGFCREGENYWYCGQHYLKTLHRITNLYTNPTKNVQQAMFIPPHTVYFIRNTSYSLNHGPSNSTGLTGSVMMLTCNSSIQIPGYVFNAADFVSCSDITNNNVFIHGGLHPDDPNFYTFPSQVQQLEEFYNRDITPIITNIHNYQDLFIDSSQDKNLTQQYETLRNDFDMKYKKLLLENQRILQLINNMHSIDSETPIYFYIIIGVLVLFILKLFRII
ncbi:ORF2a [Alphamesonivirus daknongense]|uniref:ORF2a n=1 Tax=Alphamesonivirus daknongense TaxID=1945561 RepID=M4JUR1_9NIDO|nr:ORF2a [Alphamesonivirus 3]AGE00057.1 ORF2a [Alphamesonivirus 3]